MGRIYLYGIVEGTRRAPLGVHGMDGVSPVRLLAGVGLGAVVSNYQGQELAGLTREELLRCLLAHQQVVERAMAGHTVLPAKFGMLLDSAGEVRDLLSSCQEELTAALAAIRGKVEMAVTATWDVQRVLAEIGREEAVVGAREAIAGQGDPRLEDRVRLGQLVKTHLDERREDHKGRLVQFLRPLALDVAENVLLSDEMVMNVSFLIERAQEEEFDRRLWHLDQLYGGELAFRAVGPLPPYSFSTVEATRLAPETVEEARGILGLGESFSQSELRQAYRRLAAAAQRELARGDEEAKVRFARLRWAADLLGAGSGAGRSASQGQPGEPRWAVTIRRAGRNDVQPARFGAGA